MKTDYQKGFGPLLVVLVIALIAGSSVYVAKKNKETKLKNETSGAMNAEVSMNTNGNSDGTLRGLLSMKKNVMCTISRTDSGTNVSGTAYISGDMMRGDFTMKSGSSSAMDSHMIKNGTMMYVWTGTQGAKMDVSQFETNASAQSNNAVSLDQKVEYTCSDWLRDESKFEVPSTIAFMDLNTMINGQGSINGQPNSNINSNVNMGLNSNQCASCGQLPAGSAREQCKIALQCK